MCKTVYETAKILKKSKTLTFCGLLRKQSRRARVCRLVVCVGGSPDVSRHHSCVLVCGFKCLEYDSLADALHAL